MNGTELIENGTCDPIVKKEHIVFVLVSVLEIVLNLVIIVAAIRGRRILRHNYVYAYVTSTLASNVALGIGSALMVLMNYTATKNSKVDFTLSEDKVVMQWWVFRKSFTLAVFLIMSGSIASLIYGLRESSYFIGKFSSNTALNKMATKRGSLKTRKNKAMAIILSVWFFPCLTSMLPPLLNTCMYNCRCHPAVYNQTENVCQTNVYKQCSATWVPISKGYLASVFAVWLLLILIVVFLLATTISLFLKAVAPTKTSISTENEIESGGNFFSPRRKFPRMNHSIKLLLYLTLSYFIFTSPSMIVIALDLLSYAHFLTFTSGSLMFMMSLLYTFVSPVLLVKYMPGLRSAVIDLFSLCCRTSTTRSAKKMTEATKSSSFKKDASSNAPMATTCGKKNKENTLATSVSEVT